MIFQALGAKYTFTAAVKHLFAGGSEQDSEKLRQALKKRYGGEVVLYHKGRAALTQAIRVATGGSGRVAISGLTCYSVVQAVEAAGCTPVFVDIRESDLHFGPEELSTAMTKRGDIKAIVVQNMLGIPVDIAAIEAIAAKHNAVLIEDLAHSAGAYYADGREVGTVGDIAMLSFGRDKAIDTVNGGALILRTPHAIGYDPIAEQQLPGGVDQFRNRLYPLIAWLTRSLYPVKIGPYVMAVAIKLRLVVRSADGEVDTNETLPHWQAKLALDQVRRLTTTAVSRRQKTWKYLAALAKFAPLALQGSDPCKGMAPVRVPLLVDNRDEVVAHLRAHGVQANDIWYDVPVSPQRLYGKVDYPEDECPVAVRTATRLVNLPTHERISTGDIECISNLVREVARA